MGFGVLGGGKGTYNATDIGLDQALGHEVGMFLGQTRLKQELRGEILSLAGPCIVAGLGSHCLFDLGWQEENQVLRSGYEMNTTVMRADSHYRSMKATLWTLMSVFVRRNYERCSSAVARRFQAPGNSYVIRTAWINGVCV